MELEELKKNWNIMEERLGNLEMEQRRELNKTVSSKVQQVRERLLRRIVLIIFLVPLLLLFINHHESYSFSPLTWVLMFFFVAIILARQLTWSILLKKIDCLTLTVREVCLAESRFRMSFKIGIAVSLLSAIPLLASMIWDMSRFGDRYMMMGVWTGLAVGSVIGLHKFRKSWRGIKELREAIADLQ